MSRSRRPAVTGTLALLVALVVFVVPFLFIALQAVKTRRDASRLSFAAMTAGAVKG